METSSFDKVTIRSVVLTGIFTLMIMYTLYLAAPLFRPLTVAFLLSLMFSPAVRRLRKLKIPPPVSATIIVAGLFVVLVGAVYGLAAPASKWVQTAPQALNTIDNELYQLFAPIKEELEEAKEAVKQTVPGGAEKSADKSQGESRWQPIQWLLTSTWSLVYGLGVSVILLYFMLASGDSFLRTLLRRLPRFATNATQWRLFSTSSTASLSFWARSQSSTSALVQLLRGLYT